MNRYGENNCFLNVIVQMLRGLRPFAERLSRAKSHRCPDRKDCVVCSLGKVMETMAESVKPVSLTRLRAALHSLLLAQHGDGVFAACVMGDAGEALEDILKLIHTAELTLLPASHPLHRPVASAGKRAPFHVLSMRDVPPTSIALGSFGIRTSESSVCTTCGASSSPVEETMLALHVNSRSISEAVARPGSAAARFDAVLHAVACADSKRCEVPGCRGHTVLRRQLLQDVPVFTVAIGWSAVTPPAAEQNAVVSAVEPFVDLGVVFDDLAHAGSASLYCRLRGVVCYTSSHYVALCDVSPDATTQWVCYNDERVFRVEDALAYCKSSRFAPQLLLYESQGVGTAKPVLRPRAIEVPVDAGATAAAAAAGAAAPASAPAAPLSLDSPNSFPSLAQAASRRK